MPSTLTDGRRQVFRRVLQDYLEQSQVDMPGYASEQFSTTWFESSEVDRERVQKELDWLNKWEGINLTIDSLKLLEVAVDYLADET